MGIAKRKWMEMMEGGYSSVPNKHVCAACLTEPDLIRILFPPDDPGDVCSYCRGDGAVPVDNLVEQISGAILAEYTDPANELPFESAEGGYQGHVQDGSEIVLFELDSWTENDDLLEDVADAFAGSSWCKQRYFSLTKLEGLTYGWESFVEQVKHRTRYLFLQELEEDDELPDPESVPPGRMLDALARLWQEHVATLVLSPGKRIYRVRVHDKGNRPTDAAALGAPSHENACRSNRMSPAGVSMFYGALDTDTAVLETFERARGTGRKITAAVFTPTRNLHLLDLTRIPDVPSQFCEDDYHLRMPLSFLHRFVEDLRSPVSRDAMEHVEYVPTQIVTEHVRHRFQTTDGHSLDGMAYTSAREGGGTALVIFADDTLCGPRPERQPWEPEVLLSLVESETYDPSAFARLW